MFYRPKFCCHCGEKISRAKWLPWTSRRFCEFCEVEQMQHELLPKAVIVIALLIGAAGVVSYFGSSATSLSARTKSEPSDQLHELKRPASNREKPNGNAVEAQASPAVDVPEATKLQREVKAVPSTEPVYYCGALTRKGTPCTRRLKTRGRCWQHIGQPSVEDAPKFRPRP